MKKNKSKIDYLNIFEDTPLRNHITDAKIDELVTGIEVTQKFMNGELIGNTKNLRDRQDSSVPTDRELHSREYEDWIKQNQTLSNMLRSIMLRFLSDPLPLGVWTEKAAKKQKKWDTLSEKEKRKMMKNKNGDIPTVSPGVHFEHINTVKQLLFDIIVSDIFYGRIKIDKNSKKNIITGKNLISRYGFHAIGLYSTDEENTKIIKPKVNSIMKEEQTKASNGMKDWTREAERRITKEGEHYDTINFSSSLYAPTGQKMHPHLIPSWITSRMKEPKVEDRIGVDKFLLNKETEIK